MKLPISCEIVKNICAMLDRAKLTKDQAYECSKTGQFTKEQYEAVVEQMNKIEVNCKIVLAEITFEDITYLIPESSIEAANKISKSFLAISALDKTRAQLEKNQKFLRILIRSYIL